MTIHPFDSTLVQQAILVFLRDTGMAILVFYTSETIQNRFQRP